MKFATIAVSTLLAVLTVESVAVRAETLSQPFAKETTILAQRRKKLRRRSNFSRRKLRKSQQHHFRHRSLRRFPGRFQHRPFQKRRRSVRKHYPSVRYYPYIHRSFPRYSPHYYPYPRRVYIHRSSFPNQRTYIAPEHVAPKALYDRHGLANRLILSMVADPGLKPLLATLDVRQKGKELFLSGEVPSQEALDKVIELAKQLQGTQKVHSSEVVVLAEPGF